MSHYTLVSNRKVFKRAFWLVTFVSVFVMFRMILQSSADVMQAGIVSSFSLSSSTYHTFSHSFLWTYIAMQIPMGLLLDKYGPRRVMTLSLLVIAASGLIAGLSLQFRLLQLARVLMGMGSSVAFIGGLSLLNTWISKKRFAFAAGCLELFCLLGVAFGDDLMNLTIRFLGWRMTTIMEVIFALLFAFLTWMTIRDQPPFALRREMQQSPIAWHKKIGILLGTPQVWVLGGMATLLYAPIIVFASNWSIPFLMHAQQIALGSAKHLQMVIFLGGGIGAPLMGWFSNAIGKRKWVLLLGALGALFALSMVMMDPEMSRWDMQFYLFLFGLFSAAYMLPFAIIREHLLPSMHSTAFGFIDTMCFVIGVFCLGPFVAHVTGTADGSLQRYWHFLSPEHFGVVLSGSFLCLGIALLLGLFVEETHCEMVYLDNGEI